MDGSARARMLERAHAARDRAKILAEQARASQAEAERIFAELDQDLLDEKEAMLAEQEVQELPVYDEAGKAHIGCVQFIQTPWEQTGRGIGSGCKKRLVGVGRGGRLLVVYELRDTSSVRGKRTLERKYGDAPPLAVDLAIHRKLV
jgi:hypothetical protein